MKPQAMPENCDLWTVRGKSSLIPTTKAARHAGISSGSVLAHNTVAIDVFADQQLAVPEAKIAVLDVNDSLHPFLTSAGIPFVEFNADTHMSLPVFVSKAYARKPDTIERFAKLKEFVQQGGNAVYLETVPRGDSFWTHWMPPKNVLPVSMTSNSALGLWVGVSHVITNHPVFKGLPSEQMMGQIYENVWTPQTLMGTDGELIVGSVSHGWYQGENDSKHHQGPSAAWYGMDIGIVPSGNGRYVLLALRIVENLGKDPVADKILFNLIEWTSGKSD